MSSLPFRTHATALTDVELVLLDVLFDGSASFRLLRSETFRPQWGLGYQHDLDDASLHELLTSFCRRGLVAATACEDGPRFQMTVAGGAMWSAER